MSAPDYCEKHGVFEKGGDDGCYVCSKCYIEANDELAAAKEGLKEAQELILDLFNQGGGRLSDGRLDHMCLSTYEDAQRYLLKVGAIQPCDCVRPLPEE